MLFLPVPPLLCRTDLSEAGRPTGQMQQQPQQPQQHHKQHDIVKAVLAGGAAAGASRYMAWESQVRHPLTRGLDMCITRV